MSDKPKFPRADALRVCRELLARLTPMCERIIVAGSLRRRKELVGDVEILYIPTFGRVVKMGQLFEEIGNLADAAINRLQVEGILVPRKSKTGTEAMGSKNKLMLHVASGIPVDLFAATESNWFNYLVCRTGGMQNNIQIAARAQEQGYKWNPYGAGFTHIRTREVLPMTSERAVFDFVSLPYLEPWERE